MYVDKVLKATDSGHMSLHGTFQIIIKAEHTVHSIILFYSNNQPDWPQETEACRHAERHGGGRSDVSELRHQHQ